MRKLRSFSRKKSLREDRDAGRRRGELRRGQAAEPTRTRWISRSLPARATAARFWFGSATAETSPARESCVNMGARCTTNAATLTRPSAPTASTCSSPAIARATATSTSRTCPRVSRACRSSALSRNESFEFPTRGTYRETTGAVQCDPSLLRGAPQLCRSPALESGGFASEKAGLVAPRVSHLILDLAGVGLRRVTRAKATSHSPCA